MWALSSDFLQRHPLATGVAGTFSSLGAASLSFMQQFEIAVRVAGGIIGIAIGVLTLVIQIRNIRNK